jgi:DNA-binding MurR/RpiR family transcriptional regulator
MIQKVVRKTDFKDFSEVKANLSYWLSKTPEERVGAVELLRRRYHGSPGRLQRSARVIQRS